MNVRPYLAGLRALAVAVLTCLVQVAFAQPVAPTTFSNTTAGFGAWYFGGGATLGTGGNGLTPMPTRPTNPANLSGWTTAGNFGMAPSATGVTVNAQSDFSVPGTGKTAAMNMTGTLNKPALGKALATLGKALPIIGNGIMLFEAAKEIGFLLSKNADGSVQYQRQNAANCTVAPCYEYTTNPSLIGFKATPEDACNFYVLLVTGSGFPYKDPFVTYGSTGTQNHLGAVCHITWTFNNLALTQGIAERQRTPDAAVVYDPSSEQAFIDAIANKSGWPSTSDIAKAAADAIAHGQKLQIDSKVWSGPSSITGPSSSTTDSTGKVVNNTITYNITYNGDTITYNTTNITKTTNPDGTTATSTQTKNEDPPIEPCKGSDADTIGCSRYGTPEASDTLSRDTKNITVTPAMFTGGSCPGPITFSAFNRSYAFSYSTLCSKLQSLAPLFLALASLAAAWILADSFKVG